MSDSLGSHCHRFEFLDFLFHQIGPTSGRGSRLLLVPVDSDLHWRPPVELYVSISTFTTYLISESAGGDPKLLVSLGRKT